MKLKNLKIGNFSYLDIKYPQDAKPELIRKSKEDEELENINKFLRELYYYKYCNKEKDDECKHCRCMYSVSWFSRDGFRATCGRRDSYVKEV